MSDATRIETVFYELEARTDLFERNMATARRTIRTFAGEPTPPVKLAADTAAVDTSVEKAKKKVREIPGAADRPAVVKLSGDVAQLEQKLTEAKKLAAEVGATREGKPLVAKLDAQISAFEAKLATAKQRLDTLLKTPASVKLDADTARLSASLKSAQNSVAGLTQELSQRLNGDAGVEEATSRVGEFAESFEVAGVSASGAAGRIAEAFKSPASAVAVVSAALVTLVGVATGAAAQFDTDFRKLRSSLPGETDAVALGSLRQEIVDLSLVSPRTAADLNNVATAISKMGEADPAEIGANLRTIALVGDAVSATDLNPLANQLDLIGDAFGLTAEEARQAYVQIAAMTKGKIELEELANVLARSATRMDALQINAQEAAAAVTVLVDAGVNSRQITTGLIDLLEKSGTAERAAIEAAAAGKESDAAALRVFAASVNESTIASRGLVGALGDLFRNLDGSRERFAAAGLSLNDFQIAAKAADATTAGATARVLSYAESLDKLGPAAQVNRESATALAQVIRNELSAQLLELGNVFLPTVNRGLQIFLDLLSSTRRAAKDAAEAIPDAQRLLDQGRTGFAVRRLQPTIAGIQQSPGMIDGYNLGQLRDLQGVFRRLQNEGEGSDGLGKALAIVETRIRALSGAAATVVTATAPAAKGLDDVSAAAKRLAEKNREAEERFQELLVSIGEYAQGIDTANRPLAAFATRQDAVRRELDKAIALLPKVRQASARQQADTLLDQLADAGERLRASQAVDLADKLATLLGRSSTDAVEALRREYAGLTKQLTEVAEAADTLGTEEGRLTAQRAREGIVAIEGQRDALIEVQRAAYAFARAQQTIATFEAQANANFTDTGVTLADYRRALHTLTAEENRLKAMRDAAAVGTLERAKAEEVLKRVQQERIALEKNGQSPAIVTADAATNAVRLAGGLRAAAQSGLGLVQILGQGADRLGTLLAGVSTLASGIESVSQAASKAGGFGKLFSSGAGIASALPGLTQTVGGIVAITQSLTGNDAVGKAQRDAMNANTAAIIALSRNVADLGGSFSGSQLRGVFDGITRLFAEGRTPSNFANFGLFKIGQRFNNTALNDPKLPDYVRIDPAQFFASVGTSLADVEAVAKKLGIQLDGTVGSYRKFAEALATADFEALANTLDGVNRRLALLSRVNGRGNDPLEDIANKFRSLIGLAPEIAKAFDVNDVFTPEGRQRLRDNVAALLKQVLNFDPNSAEAKDFVLNQLGGLSVDEFLSLFSGILDGLDGFAAGLEEFVGELDAFQKAARVLGIEGAGYVTGLINALGNSIPELAGILNGLDLTNTADVETLKDRLRTLFRTLQEGGLTLEEGKITDAIVEILNALGLLPAALSQVDQALNAFKERANIFGESNTEQFTSQGALLKAKFPSLDTILGPNFQQEILTAEGRERLKSSIGAAIRQILDDGVISAEEAPILEALKFLFGLVKGAIQDASDEAERAANQAAEDRAQEQAARDEAEQKRRDGLAQASADAGLENALNDATGADAFFTSLGAFGEKFRKALGPLDVSSVEGIEVATGKLKTFYASIEGLSDEQLVERFGMTRDEIVTALTQIDNGLDNLGTGLETLATRQADFLDQLNLAYFDAFGQGLDAVRLQTEIWVEQMIATAETLNLLTPELERRIRAIGAQRVTNAANQMRGDARVGPLNERVVTDGVSSSEPPLGADGTITAQSVSSISATQALSITDLLAAAYVEQRATRVATETMAAMLGALVLGTIPPLQVPSLPASVGGFAAGGAGGFTLVVQVNGPVLGITPAELGREIADAALPYLNESLARAAGIEARLAGDASL